jgi:hypothetical protein
MGVVLAAKKDLSISQTHSEKGTFCRQHNWPSPISGCSSHTDISFFAYSHIHLSAVMVRSEQLWA